MFIKIKKPVATIHIANAAVELLEDIMVLVARCWYHSAPETQHETICCSFQPGDELGGRSSFTDLLVGAEKLSATVRGDGGGDLRQLAACLGFLSEKLVLVVDVVAFNPMLVFSIHIFFLACPTVCFGNSSTK